MRASASGLLMLSPVSTEQTGGLRHTERVQPSRARLEKGAFRNIEEAHSKPFRAPGEEFSSVSGTSRRAVPSRGGTLISYAEKSRDRRAQRRDAGTMARFCAAAAGRAARSREAGDSPCDRPTRPESFSVPSGKEVASCGLFSFPAGQVHKGATPFPRGSVCFSFRR